MSILVVDDQADIRMVLQAILKAAGHTDVVLAESAGEAFRRLSLDDPTRPCGVDLILMDIFMTSMDGIDACRIIKGAAHLQSIPILMVTGRTEMSDLKAAFAAGAMDYITKPVKQVELMARVNSALTLKAQMDARHAREQELQKRNEELERALQEIKVLRGFIPICATCKSIRNDQGSWQRMEAYIQEHTDAEFSHSICNDCLKKVFPELAGEAS
jgi:sigma-B regulation protein RsbU (phosphoserine phosphatase)